MKRLGAIDVVDRKDFLPPLEWDTVVASDSYLDLGRAPYGLHGVKYIDIVSLAPLSGVPQHVTHTLT